MTVVVPRSDRAAFGSARSRLVERAVLTRAVVSELQRCEGRYDGERPAAALALLLRWIEERFPVDRAALPHDGLTEAPLPEGYEALLAEVAAGADICRALWNLQRADTDREVDHDTAELRRLLAAYAS